MLQVKHELLYCTVANKWHKFMRPLARYSESIYLKLQVTKFSPWNIDHLTPHIMTYYIHPQTHTIKYKKLPHLNCLWLNYFKNNFHEIKTITGIDLLQILHCKSPSASLATKQIMLFCIHTVFQLSYYAVKKKKKKERGGTMRRDHVHALFTRYLSPFANTTATCYYTPLVNDETSLVPFYNEIPPAESARNEYVSAFADRKAQNDESCFPIKPYRTQRLAHRISSSARLMPVHQKHYSIRRRGWHSERAF